MALIVVNDVLAELRKISKDLDKNMIKIYKLRYDNKEAALQDLKSKKVIDAKEQYINGTEAVVNCGVLTLVKATETEAAIFADGYHYDIMTSDDMVFDSEVFPKNAKYKFGGE
jgi:FMN-dependent NADH-azoreductase